MFSGALLKIHTHNGGSPQLLVLLVNFHKMLDEETGLGSALIEEALWLFLDVLPPTLNTLGLKIATCNCRNHMCIITLPQVSRPNVYQKKKKKEIVSKPNDRRIQNWNIMHILILTNMIAYPL